MKTATKFKAKANGGYFVPAEAKVALVVRIRGINKLHPDVKKTLRLLRLPQLHNAVLLKINNSTLKMLKRVEPFITFGYPTKKTVSDLIYKRGYGKVNGQRIQLQDNKFVEGSLGNLGIVCVEDLIHELYTCGENFKKANNFLWYFLLVYNLGHSNLTHQRRDLSPRESHSIPEVTGETEKSTSTSLLPTCCK